MSNPTEKTPLTWRVGLVRLAKMLVVTAVIAAPMVYANGRYQVVFDNVKGADCLPYSTYIIDLNDKNVTRGDYVAFAADQMEPFYKKGTKAVKIMAGIPGDHIVIDEKGISINGRGWGPLTHLGPGEKLRRMGRKIEEYVRDERIPPQHFAMMGTYERSFDSRYWGYIRNEQIIGKAIPLW